LHSGLADTVRPKEEIMAQEIKKQGTGGTPTRYRDPFAEMRAEMDRVFDTFLGRSFFGRSPWLNSSEPTSLAAPNVDVRENEKEIVFEAELPGIDDKDIQVVVRDGVLTLKGEKKAEETRRRTPS
jgi:HSP20 family protein